MDCPVAPFADDAARPRCLQLGLCAKRMRVLPAFDASGHVVAAVTRRGSQAYWEVGCRNIGLANDGRRSTPMARFYFREK